MAAVPITIDANNLMASVPITSIEAKDLRYCSKQNYQVKITRATVSLEPVADGKQITFSFSAFTDQVIPGGEMVIYLSRKGIHFHSEKYNLSDGVPCPISVGDFGLTFSQVLPVDVSPGSYSFKLKLLNQDGRQLSCVAFDFTIPSDSTTPSQLVSKDLRYCTNQNYPVKINRATVSLETVADAKRLIAFTFSGFTDQVILGGEMIIDLLFRGVQFYTDKYNLSDWVSCPISAGDFVLTFCQYVPATATPGSYSIKLKLLNQDGRQLSWVALDFTIPVDPTILNSVL